MADVLDRLNAALANRYAVEREIGQGGMATVYLAEDLRHHRSVAVKVLNPDLSEVLGAERFLREIEIAAGLQHPHILPLYDSGQAEGFLFYVMPYVEGPTLQARLAKEAELPVNDAVRIIRDVVDALSEAHAHGVVHRDIKPANILLRGRHALVTDFGVAKAVSEAAGGDTITTAGVAVGTPAYMAPEQASADPNVDHRADIYAVGAVAYEVLAGRPVFVGTTPQRVLTSHVTEAPRPVSEHRAAVPPALESVVMRCLEKRPADRWQTAEELLVQLEGTITPSGGTAPVQATAPAGARRHTGRLGAGIAAALVIAAAGVGLWARGSGEGAATDLVENRVVVIPFANLTGDTIFSALGAMVAGSVTRNLNEVAEVEVVPQATVLPLYQEAEEAGPVAIAEQTRAGLVVSGTLARLGDQLQLEVQVTEGGNQELVASVDPVLGSLSDPTAAVEELGQRVMSVLGMRYRWDRTRITSGRVPRWDAFQEANRGGPAFSEGRFLDFRDHNLRAYALDTTYVEFLYWAAVGAFNAGNRHQADSLLNIVSARRSELPGDLQDFVEWLHAGLRGDAYGRYYAMRRNVDQFGVWGVAGPQLGLELVNLNRPGEAVAVFEQVDIELPPMRDLNWCWDAYTWALHHLGEYERELEVARLGRALQPTYVPRYLHEVRALVALGDVPQALALLQEALTVSPTSISLALWTAVELQNHGHGEAALEALAPLIEWADGQPENRGLSNRGALIMLLVNGGALDEARRLLEEIPIELRIHDSPAARHARGVYLGRTGEQASATRIAEELSAEGDEIVALPDELERPRAGWYYFFSGSVHAAAGNAEAAVQELIKALEANGPLMRGRVNSWPTLRAWLGDYPPYQELIRPVG